MALFHGWNNFDEADFLILSSQQLLVLIYQPLKDEQHKYRNLIQRKEYRSLIS